MHGTKTSNLGVSECDLLVTIGARFSDRVLGNSKFFAKNAKILQFDVDAAEINKNIMTDGSVIGDVKCILQRINEKLGQTEHKQWMQHVMEMKQKYPLTYNKGRLTGPGLIETISEVTKGEAIITTEVGQHQMWAAQYYQYRSPRTFLTSGGLGTMGYGLGASIGAKVGKPDVPVINIAGDGCFRMNMNEMATAARYQIPIIEIIVNNHVLGMVRQWQNLFYEERYSCTTLKDGVDFVLVAQACGAQGVRVTTMEEFRESFEKALKAKGPVLIDCQIDSDDKVWPMVAPGAPIDQVFTEEDM